MSQPKKQRNKTRAKINAQTLLDATANTHHHSPDIVSSGMTESWQLQELPPVTCPAPLVVSLLVLTATDKQTYYNI